MAIDASLPHSNSTVVRLPAEIDLASAPALRDEMLASLNRGGVHLVLDGLGVTFMDSSGVNALVRARERADRLGGSLHLVATHPQVRRVLQITGLEERLGLVGSLEAALACVAHPETIHTCSPET